MHLFLTDRLACARCGPEFGLILLANKVEEQRVLVGELGCPNCRERYPVRDGLGDLRPPPRGSLNPRPNLGGSPPAPEEGMRVAALLGVTEGPGTLLLQGPAVRFGPWLADLLGQVEVVCQDAHLMEGSEFPGLSRIAAGPQIPFFSGTFLGALLSGGAKGPALEEGARVVAPLGRLVVMDAPLDCRTRLEEQGFSVLLEEEGVVVAQRARRDPVPLVTLRGP